MRPHSLIFRLSSSQKILSRNLQQVSAVIANYHSATRRHSQNNEKLLMDLQKLTESKSQKDLSLIENVNKIIKQYQDGTDLPRQDLANEIQKAIDAHRSSSKTHQYYLQDTLWQTTINLAELLQENVSQQKKLKASLGHISIFLDTGAVKSTVIRFDIGELDPELALKKLNKFLLEKYPQEDCRKGQALFIDPSDDKKLILMTYRLYRTTSVPQSIDGFANTLKEFINNQTSLDALNAFYFEAFGLSVKKFVNDNKVALESRGVNQETIDKLFEILHTIANEGRFAHDYYMALLSADILMQQGKAVAAIKPMQDFWGYAISAGISLNKPELKADSEATFSSVIPVPGYNLVEGVHPAYAAQMTVGLQNFIESVKKVAAENGEKTPRVIDAGPCTGTILIAMAEMYRDIEFIAVEPDEPSCKILLEAIKQRGVCNVRVIQKPCQDISLQDDLEGKKIHGLYSSFAAHHMPLPKVLAKLNEIGYPNLHVLITDEWTSELGSLQKIRQELMKYHVPIILERCKLLFTIDLDKLKEEDPNITEEQINLIKDFSKDAHILHGLLCEENYQSANEKLEEMEKYNQRYADIFDKISETESKQMPNPIVSILLFGIQEFAALIQGVKQYLIEHKGSVDYFTDFASKDYGFKEVRGNIRVMGVESPSGLVGKTGFSGIYSTHLVGNRTTSSERG